MTEEWEEKQLKYLDLNLEHFTHKELASSAARDSGFYDIDKIMERMDHLFETKLKRKDTKIKQMVKTYTAPIGVCVES